MIHKQGGNQYSSSSCQRCRMKKLKCDDDTIACKHCVRSHTECLFVDPRTKNAHPRRYLSQLRSRVRELEDEITIANGIEVDGNDNLRGGSSDQHNAGNSLDRQEEISIGLTAGPGNHYHGVGSITSIAKLVAAAVSVKATNLASIVALGDKAGLQAFQADYNRAQPAAILNAVEGRKLLTSYLSGFHLLHPFLQEASLKTLFEEMSALENDDAINAPNAFRYFMVCAIGALRLNRSALHATPAIDYYTSAMTYKQDALNVGGLGQVQNMLLITQFGVLYETGISNKWDLARLAIRACIKSGYHRLSSQEMAPMEDQMQRRVFWTAYILDRQASITVGRPFSIADGDISLQLPIDVDDDLIGLPDCLPKQHERGPSTVCAQLRQIKIRQISSRIHQILSLPDNSPSSEQGCNLSQVLTDLDCWRASIPRVSGSLSIYQTMAWIDLNYYKERLSCYKFLVFQAFPRQHISNDSNLQFCIEASIGVAENYVGLVSCDERIMNWMCVQDILSAGFSILYCLHLSYRRNIFSKVFKMDDPLLHRAFKAIDTCSGFLSLIASRWKSVGREERAFSAIAAEIRRQIELTSIVDVASSGDLRARVHGESQEALMPADNTFLDFSAGQGNSFFVEEDLITGVDFDNVDWDQIFPSDLTRN